MAGVLSNLYPPIIDTAMPAFIRTSSCRVYFSLSSYNSATDIAQVQVTVSNQNNSLTALSTTLYPSGVKFCNLQIDTDKSSDDKYYITINASDLKDGIFALNQYYKVQIRFSTTYFSSTNPKDATSWMVANQNYFSEWSTVCLIKGIAQPILSITGFDDDSVTTSEETVFTITDLVTIAGSVSYSESEKDETEYISYYEINIYDSSDAIAYESGVLYTNEYNPLEINHNIKTNLTDGVVYTLEVIYTTNNGYTNSQTYSFMGVSVNIDSLNATVTTEADEENGRIKVSVVSTDGVEFLSNLCIRRTSSESNFTIWEDVFISVIANGTALNFDWYDYTVESGVWYRYAAQKINGSGHRSTVVLDRAPVMILLDDIFLTRADMQLRVKYDPSVTSFKQTHSESKVDTIGSVYPYIRRNGNTAYRQFSLSGLITAFMDEEGIFINKESLYGDMLEYYEDFNEENQITDYNDFIYERKFREQVMDFLYSNNAVLFRSVSEGNILIRLMDISFTPNASLGRMLYSFSATAYEIDECSLDNFTKYNIQIVGNWSSDIQYSYEKKGQYFDTIPANKNIRTLIQNQITAMTISNYTQTLNYLKWIRLDFQEDPYLIECSGDNITAVSNSSKQTTTDSTGTSNSSEQTVTQKALVHGYIVTIGDNTDILVSARRYYELSDEDTAITNIRFPRQTDVIVDYIADIIETESVNYPSKYNYYIKAGQLWGSFEANTSLSQQIYNKYYVYKEGEYYTTVTAIDRISIESIPGAVFYIKDSFDDAFYRHEIGLTGILDLYDDETTITSFYVSGVHLTPLTVTGDISLYKPREYEYVDTEETYNSLDEITSPKDNYVYTIVTSTDTTEEESTDSDTSEEATTVYDEDNEAYSVMVAASTEENKYIWYHNNWYSFTSNGDVLCSVDCLVDYTYELVTGEY